MSGSHRLITIGQLAAYAGVTIKAVRVYHDRGLLPEPPRDASGYRRYDAYHAIQLVKIKTLVDAAVPLARIAELLTAPPDDFAAAIADIDAGLRRRAEEISRARQRIAQLDAGDRLFVTPAVADYLDRLRGLGISDRTIRLERDLWILLQAVSPAQAAEWVADKLEAIDDPEFRALYRDYDAAFDWPPDDPRLPDLATRTNRWYATHGPEPAARPTPTDLTITRLAAAAAASYSPSWTRLSHLSKEQLAAEPHASAQEHPTADPHAPTRAQPTTEPHPTTRAHPTTEPGANTQAHPTTEPGANTQADTEPPLLGRPARKRAAGIADNSSDKAF